MEKKVLIFLVAVYISAVHGLPSRVGKRYNLSYLNSTSILGTVINTQSNATATGLGSTVEISGIVTGETAGEVDVESTPQGPGSSSIVSQVNCSEYSTSSASGGLTADAIAGGDCLMTIDDTGSYQFQSGTNTISVRVSKQVDNKVEIGMGGQVTNQGQAQPSATPEGAQDVSITQSTSQNPADGSAQAYQMVSGPNTASSFSGVMAQAAQGDLVQGTQETLMTHNSGDTNFQSLVTPFASAKTIKA